jgi:hypothetical protein
MTHKRVWSELLKTYKATVVYIAVVVTVVLILQLREAGYWL